MKKYPPGTKLQVLVDCYSTDKYFGSMCRGKIITIVESKRYPENYNIKENNEEHGWIKVFIEDTNKFMPLSKNGKFNWKAYYSKG